MSTKTARSGAPAPNAVGGMELINRADRNRWTRHLEQIAASYPLAHPRILRADSLPVRANSGLTINS
jgi:hypothetical protein